MCLGQDFTATMIHSLLLTVLPCLLWGGVQSHRMLLQNATASATAVAEANGTALSDSSANARRMLLQNGTATSVAQAIASGNGTAIAESSAQASIVV